MSGLKEMSLKIGDAGVDESNKRAVESDMVAIHKTSRVSCHEAEMGGVAFYGDK